MASASHANGIFHQQLADGSAKVELSGQLVTVVRRGPGVMVGVGVTSAAVLDGEGGVMGAAARR